MARILGWCWSHRFFKTAIFLFIFICLAPNLIYFMGVLNTDGIFAVATAGLLFEIGLISRLRKVSCMSLIIILISFPFAVFVRGNGIIFLFPIFALFFMVNRAARVWIGVIVIGWCGLAAIGPHPKSQEASYSLAIYETVNFLQPRPMNFWVVAPRVSPLTITTLTRYHPLEVYLSYYDPDYWDPLNFDANGPHVTALSKHDRKIITREFFRYNLWHNIPKFMGSRVNIFLVSALGQGAYLGVVAPDDYLKNILDQVHSKSTYRMFNLEKIAQLLKKIYNSSDYQYRSLLWGVLWTPFLGIGLMIYAFYIGIQKRNLPLLLVSIPAIGELTGIFIFSTAGEYRYLLPFFTLPLALLPTIVAYFFSETE